MDGFAEESEIKIVADDDEVFSSSSEEEVPVEVIQRAVPPDEGRKVDSEPTLNESSSSVDRNEGPAPLKMPRGRGVRKPKKPSKGKKSSKTPKRASLAKVPKIKKAIQKLLNSLPN